MTRKKILTGNEIISALESCRGVKLTTVKMFVIKEIGKVEEVENELYVGEILDLIDRQMEDIKRKSKMLESALEENFLLRAYRGENIKLREENKILSKNAAEAFREGLNENRDLFTKEILKEFAHFLIDRSEGGVIPICDLPDLVIDFQTKENK